jgi:hypothetical protein
MRLLVIMVALIPAFEQTNLQPLSKKDLIREALETKKKEYTDKVKRAKADLLVAFDNLTERVKRDRRQSVEFQAGLLKRIEADKKEFADSEKLPELPALNRAIIAYEKALTRASKLCADSFQKAANDYRNKGDIARASATMQEGQRFITPPAELSSRATSEGGVLLATGEGEQGVVWYYTTERPEAGWNAPQFRPLQWNIGEAPFGKPGMPGVRSRTLWNSKEIWLRRELIAPRILPGRVVMLRIYHDDDARIYINGELLVELPGWADEYRDIPLNDKQTALFRQGTNTIAVNCVNGPVGGSAGGQAIDLGLTILKR